MTWQGGRAGCKLARKHVFLDHCFGKNPDWRFKQHGVHCRLHFKLIGCGVSEPDLCLELPSL